MGVHGLWRLIEPSGKQVPLETLENKILAVDISIWLHQAIKGYQDSRGASVPNAHLLGVYQRLCKLLYYRIRPVFVFDGGVPALKKQTIQRRRQLKSQHEDESEKIHHQILTTILKQSAVDAALVESYIQSKSNENSPTKSHRRNDEKDDLFKLPELPSSQPDASTEDSLLQTDSEDSPPRHKHHIDIDTIDEKSKKFKSLPPEVRHDILTEIKENSKNTCWKQLYTTPAENGEFSKRQIQRVLKRRSIQVSLQEAEQEMGGHSLSLGDLETLLHQEGIVSNVQLVAKSRIASDEHTRYLLIKDLQKAKKELEVQRLEKLKEEPEEVKSEFESDMDRALKLSLNDEVKKEDLDQPSTSGTFSEKLSKALKRSVEETEKLVNEDSEDDDLETAIKLSLQEEPKVEDSMPYLQHFNDADFMFDSSSEEEILPVAKGATSLASAFLSEYSDLTTTEIKNVLGIPKSPVKEVKANDFYPNEMLLNTPKSVKPTITKDVTRNEDDDLEGIGVISDSSSNDSDDFIAVDTKTEVPEVPKSNVLELIIDPKTIVEDDLFADVFKPEMKSEEVVITKIPEKKIIDDSKEVLNIQAANEVVEVSDIKPDTFSQVDVKEKNIVLEEPVEKSETEISQPFPTANEMDDKVEINEIPVTPKKKTITKEELEEMRRQLENDRHVLVEERNRESRMATNITDQMYSDTQTLLRLFGVPYIVAPMEAEAQCAYLDDNKLTDGTITDDSDIWLFGGKTVYKNFFSQKKHVLEFRAENIQHHFKLSREQLILLALLVGSDYTLGIQGVGPVTALEILAAFPVSQQETILTHHELISGLQHFKTWWRNGRIVGPGKAALRNKLKNISLSENFPSLPVVEAYLKPEVDLSKEKFSWGKPNVEKLREFARDKFGWSEVKSNEVIQPVMKRWQDPVSQQKILAFFKKQPIRNQEMQLSKRVKSALHKLDPNAKSSDEEEPVKKKAAKEIKPKKKRVSKKLPNEPKVVTQEVEIKPLSKLQEKLKTLEKPPSKVVPKKSREFIPQREQDKINSLKIKLRAIELYRKSKQGPGFVEKRAKKVRAPKGDAELSESSSD